jgi:AraC-like DNA-binding protein
MSDRQPFDCGPLRAYIAEHRLSEPAMAAHAGIPYRTLRGILSKGAEPRPPTRIAIERALTSPQPALHQVKEPEHAAIVRQFWATESSEKTARRCGISASRVRQIWNTLGMPPRSTLRRTTTYEPAN